jgi:hypothetical protein
MLLSCGVSTSTRSCRPQFVRSSSDEVRHSPTGQPFDVRVLDALNAVDVCKRPVPLVRIE